jgi:hypothetical protein
MASPINKLLIVGHPASGLEAVEHQLQASGMALPLPSRREGLSPKQISQILIKAHGCEALDDITEEAAFAPLDVAPVWHGMAMDLMLGNLDQSFWGWADPASIHLLDYWRTLDPTVVIVLVYDHPASALLALSGSNNAVQPLAQRAPRALDNWMAYNSALLAFHLRHGARSLLISRDQAQQMLVAYLAELEGKLQRQLPAPNIDQVLPPALAQSGVLATLADMVPLNEIDRWQATPVERYLIEQWLADQPQVMQLYAQLQGAGSLAPMRVNVAAYRPRAAWEALLEHRELVNQTLHEVLQLRDQAQKELSTTQQQSSRLLADASAKAQASHAEIVEENKLLLHQLHQVQEEFEKYFLDLKSAREQLETEIKARNKEVALKADLQKKLEAETLARQQEAAAKAKAVKQRDELSQIRVELQQKLEAETLARQQEAAAKAKAVKQRDELAQIRVELQQKLEAETLARQQQAAAKAKAVKQRDELAQIRVELQQKLEAETQAREQVAADLDKIQKQSVNTAKTKELEKENKLLLQQLHQVQEELKRTIRENQKRKNNQHKAAGHLYGAADRVKQQLAYRLGARVLKQLKSFWGTLFLYQALAWEYWCFRRDQKALKGQALPPIHTYVDAHEAEAVKQHLAYRLGLVVKQIGWNPFKWPVLPFALRAAHKAWKLQRGEQ